MSQSRALTNNSVNTDRTFETPISVNNISQQDNNVKLVLNSLLFYLIICYN